MRSQAKIMFTWYPKERSDLKIIHEENGVLTNNEPVVAKDFLKQLKHACLYIKIEHPQWFRMLCKAPTIIMNNKKVAAVIKQKDPKITEAARKDHKKYTNRLKENILNSQAPEDATKLMSLLLMMLVILKAAYLLAAFTSI